LRDFVSGQYSEIEPAVANNNAITKAAIFIYIIFPRVYIAE
jgi:hypothetical protein